MQRGRRHPWEQLLWLLCGVLLLASCANDGSEEGQGTPGQLAAGGTVTSPPPEAALRPPTSPMPPTPPAVNGVCPVCPASCGGGMSGLYHRQGLWRRLYRCQPDVSGSARVCV